MKVVGKKFKVKEFYVPKVLIADRAMKFGIKQVIDKFNDDGVKVVVGGAPLTHYFADEIGANDFAPDAGSAVDLVKEMVH
jgi:methanogenic corrinoid protein MtbC1